MDKAVSTDSHLRIGMLVTSRETIVPELWRVVDLEKKVASLKPISLGATQRQVPVSDLRRYRIKTTDQVFRGEDLVRVVRLVNPRSNEPFQYEVQDSAGNISTVREIELSVHVGSEAPDPVAMLKNLDAAPGPIAGARAELVRTYFDATTRSLGIAGYNGARMLPIPHQISAARYSLLFGRTRFLLADEVGLGKTIEAGLIISTLRKFFPDWQTALFVPESLTVQWAFEMYAKFGKSIFRLSDEDPFDDEDEDEDDPGVILPHAQGRKWSRRARKSEILVVDEAHQILRDESLYEAFVKMSRNAHAVLLLTATPTSDDGENLAKLLRLVDPEQYDQLPGTTTLSQLLSKRESVEELIGALRDDSTDFATMRKAWNQVGVEDADFETRLLTLQVDPSDMTVRHKLAALATDRYNPAARILRYQRKFLSLDNDMPERVEEQVVYQPSKTELKVQGIVRRWLDMLRDQKPADDPVWQDVAATLLQASSSSPVALDTWLAARMGELAPRAGVTGDPVRKRAELLETLEKLDGEDDLLEELQTANNKWLRDTKSLDIKNRPLARLPRYEVLLKQLKEVLEIDDFGPQRVLLFTSFEANVKPLYLLLNKALGVDVEVQMISAEMEWREREKAAFAFQESRGAAVLISDELGGEGRNFQFASTLFHFDVPYFSWMLEQRIGRLDRVGRESDLDVDSQVLMAEGGPDEALYEFQRDGVGVYNESLAPVEGVIEQFTRQMIGAMITEGADGVRELIPEIEEKIEARRDREAAGLLNRRDTGVGDVKKLIPLLEDDEELDRLGNAVINYTRLLGSVVDKENGRVTATVGSHHPLHAYTGVLAEMQGFFNRKEAVRHERLEFFSPGHPFVRSMARLALMESTDRVAFIQRAGLAAPACRVLCRISIPPAFLESIREMPSDIQPALFTSAASNFPTRLLPLTFAFDGKPLSANEIERTQFDRAWMGSTDRSLDEGSDLIGLLPDNWEEVCDTIAERALEAAEAEAATLYENGIRYFSGILSEVLTRQHGPDFAVEAQADSILFALDPLSVEIDSVRVYLP